LQTKESPLRNRTIPPVVRRVPLWFAARCLLLLATPVLLPACSGAQLDRMSSELQNLRDEVDDLKRSQAANRVQYDELRSRLVLMEDRADSKRVADERRSPVEVPELPTVRVGEPGGQQASRRVPVEGEEDDPGAPVEPAAPIQTAGAPKPATASGPAGPVPPNVGGEPPEVDPAVSLYERAKQLLDQGQMQESREVFDKLLQRYPDHDMADNALYWTGESWYAQARYVQAAETFLRVAKDYPRGNKVPDALFKLGRCYEKLGDRPGALEAWRQLQRSFPGTPAGKLATQELRRYGN
jgi:tol-pal system protein YbgF